MSQADDEKLLAHGEGPVKGFVYHEPIHPTGQALAIGQSPVEAVPYVVEGRRVSNACLIVAGVIIFCIAFVGGAMSAFVGGAGVFGEVADERTVDASSSLGVAPLNSTLPSAPLNSTLPSAPLPARDLRVDRAACTAACNGFVTNSATGEHGHCGNNNNGVCGNPSCTTGCHIAWYAASKAECVAECRRISGECRYTHPGVGPGTTTRFDFCRGHAECGCNVSPECSRGEQFPCELADGSTLNHKP